MLSATFGKACSPAAMKKFSRGAFVTLMVITLWLLVSTVSPARSQQQRARGGGLTQTNVVMILIDDMGYGDLGSYGVKDIRTPHLDRMAREGVRFTNAYSNGPNCTPTRAALMTGRYQQRVGLEWAIIVDQKEPGLPAEETSVARMLKSNDYRTAMFGKWHLGFKPEFGPLAHGFDEFFGFLSGNIDYYRHKNRLGEPDLYDGTRAVEKAGYMTDLITARSVNFIDRQEAGRPFFLYVPYNAVHAPFQPPGDPDRIPEQAKWEEGTRADYARMLERVDDGVGEILGSLVRRGLEKNTLVVFASDNGGMRLSSNGALAKGKGTLWEGGIRVACLMRWPGVLPAGAVSNHPVMTMDLTATILAATNTNPPAGRKLDGVDVLPILRRSGGSPPPPERTMFWRIDHNKLHQRAARKGKWKYLRDGDKEMLFDLDQDASERNDLSGKLAARVSEMRDSVKEWEAELARHPPMFSVK